MSNDNRQHERMERVEIIYIEVLSASGDDKSDSIMLECTSQDISQSGLKIIAEYPFLVGSILELLISFESGGFKFLLTGEVMWLESLADKKYSAGFQLMDSEHSDYAEWVKMFELDPSTV
ncbi:PilZ domain-containing protein [Aliikangiella sp. IMCC44653]